MRLAGRKTRVVTQAKDNHVSGDTIAKFLDSGFHEQCSKQRGRISRKNYRFCVWNFKLFIVELPVTGFYVPGINKVILFVTTVCRRGERAEHLQCAEPCAELNWKQQCQQAGFERAAQQCKQAARDHVQVAVASATGSAHALVALCRSNAKQNARCHDNR